jgi:hypothetical protein
MYKRIEDQVLPPIASEIEVSFIVMKYYCVDIMTL